MTSILLFLRALFWTVLVPGVVTIYLPWLILARTEVSASSDGSIVRFLGLIPMAAGAAALLKCIWDFAFAGRGTLSPVDPPRRLVVKSFYRYVRNPMYVSVLAVLLGETFFFQSLALLQYTLAWLVVVHCFVVFYEEPALRRRFGAEYDAYCGAVRRWLPGKPLPEATASFSTPKENSKV